MNEYKITWFNMTGRPQLTHEIIEAENFNDGLEYAEYKAKKESKTLYDFMPHTIANKFRDEVAKNFALDLFITEFSAATMKHQGKMINQNGYMEVIARAAYKFADIMIKEREK